MANVRSTWATSPVLLNGALSGPEWAGAGVMPIPAGFLLVKNDNNFLYIALDLVSDRSADAGVGDYFWLSFDNNGNHSITPNLDVNYGIYPTLPIRIGRQMYLGPGTWTGLLNTPSPALVASGFGPSPNSPLPHRVWEMRLPLNEIGISNLGSSHNPAIGFGLRVASSTPAFTYDFPANFYADFSNLHNILLARTPPLPAGVGGPVIGSIGLIPAAAPQLVGGYATTAPGYYIFVDEAAFGGTLNVIGNGITLQNLWAAGARKYRVMHRAGSVGAYTPLLQSWQNYRWNGSVYALESFAWDAGSMYPMTNPADDYAIDDLLIQWNTVGAVGIHELQVEFHRADGTLVASAAQTVQLMIDNNLPMVAINQVLHNGVPTLPCAMETMTDASDGVRFNLSARDGEGNLNAWTLAAYWGAGSSATVASDSYPAHRNPAHQWTGVSSQVVPAGEWVPPVTCAYQFRLSATARVTNGYGYIGDVEASYHVTLIKPQTTPAYAVRAAPERLPHGQAAAGMPPVPGLTPQKLGAGTLSPG